MPFTYEHPHPAVAADTAAFRVHGGRLEVILVRRAAEPCRGCWALPGGFVGIDEDLEPAAKRELFEETGLSAGPMEQVETFGTPGRDPRERVITVLFLTIVPEGRSRARGGDDAEEARWFPLDRLPPLAFDHEVMVPRALRRLRELARDPASRSEGAHV